MQFIYVTIHGYICVHAKLLQFCPTLWDPMDYSSWGFSVRGIVQAWIQDWVAMYISIYATYLYSVYITSTCYNILLEIFVCVFYVY